MQTINFPEYAKVLPLKNPDEINLKDTIPNKIYKVDGGRIDVENNNYYWYETANFTPSTEIEFLNQKLK
jgi:hypothetical protein